MFKKFLYEGEPLEFDFRENIKNYKESSYNSKNTIQSLLTKRIIPNKNNNDINI